MACFSSLWRTFKECCCCSCTPEDLLRRRAVSLPSRPVANALAELPPSSPRSIKTSGGTALSTLAQLHGANPSSQPSPASDRTQPPSPTAARPSKSSLNLPGYHQLGTIADEGGEGHEVEVKLDNLPGADAIGRPGLEPLSTLQANEGHPRAGSDGVAFPSAGIPTYSPLRTKFTPTTAVDIQSPINEVSEGISGAHEAASSHPALRHIDRQSQQEPAGYNDDGSPKIGAIIDRDAANNPVIQIGDQPPVPSSSVVSHMGGPGIAFPVVGDDVAHGSSVGNIVDPGHDAMNDGMQATSRGMLQDILKNTESRPSAEG